MTDKTNMACVINRMADVHTFMFNAIRNMVALEQRNLEEIEHKQMRFELITQMVHALKEMNTLIGVFEDLNKEHVEKLVEQIASEDKGNIHVP